MSSMIEVKSLRKAFGDSLALDDVSLSVPKGCVYGLVGPNGAGKSTLMAHVNGAMRPDAGEVLVDGQHVYENPEVKGRIACIPSEFFFYQQSSINDLARLYAVAYDGFDLEFFEDLCERFALDRRRAIRKFSKGMQKQVAFMLNLSLRPDVLLLDEPLDGLDPLMRKRVWGLVMGEVAQRFMTVLVSSHNLRELEGVCDCLGIMGAGKMRQEYDLSSLDATLCKVQVALADGVELPESLDVAQCAKNGRLLTLIVRGDAAEVQKCLTALDPVLLEIVPLSLEELFLFELGGEGDDL